MADVVGRAELELILNANLNQIQGQLKGISESLDKNLGVAAQQAGKKAEGAFSQVSDALGRGVGGALSIAETGFKTLATVGVGALAGLLGTSLSLGLSFQNLSQKVNAGLKSVLGIAGADKVFSDLNALATGTSSALSSVIEESKGVKKSFEEIGPSPFPREEFFKAAQQLAGFGVEANKIPPIINAVQQAVAGVGGSAQDIGELTSVFANISAQGKITGQDIQRLGIRGINAAQILGKAFDVSAAKIKQDSSVIHASSADVIDALQKGLIEQFPNATKNLGNTLDQVVDKFRSARRNIGRALVEPFVGAKSGGAAVVLLGQIDQALETLAKILTAVVTPLLQKFADKIVQFAQPLFQFNRAINQTGDALKNSTNPFIQFLAKIAGAGTLLDGITSKVSGLVGQFKGFGPVLIAAAAGFGGFSTKFLSAIPGIGPILSQLTGGLNGFRGGIIGLALAIPQVRTEILKIGQALLTALLPAFNALKPILPALTDAIGKAAAALGPALIGIIVAVSPLLVSLANAVTQLILAVTPLIPLLGQGLAAAIGTITPLLSAAVSAVSGFIDKIAGAFAGLKNINIEDVFVGLIDKFTSFGPIVSALLPVIESLAKAFGTLDFKDVFAQAGPPAKEFLNNIGALEPIMVGISVAAAATAAAFLVFKGAAAAAAVQAKVLAVGEGIATIAEFAMADGAFTLQGALLGVEAATGVLISPFVAVAAIIAAVVAAFVILYLKVQPVRDAIDGLVSAIVPKLIPALNIFVNILKVVGVVLVGVVVAAFQLLFPIIKALAEAVGGILVVAWNGLKTVLSALQPVFAAVGNVISFLGDHIKAVLIVALIALSPIIVSVAVTVGTLVLALKLLPTIINIIAVIITTVLKVAFDILGAAITLVIGVINEFIGVATFVIGIITTIGSAFAGIASTIGDFLIGAIKKLIGAFEGFGPVKDIINGVKDVFGAIGGAIDGIIDKAKKVAGAFSFLGKLNPFKSTKKDAEDTKKAIDAVPPAAAKIAPAFTAAQNAATGTFTAIQGLRDELAKLPDAAKNLESIQGIAKAIDPVLASVEKAKSANAAVGTANTGLTEATKRINDLQKERAKLLRDTISPAQEIAKAERDLTAARFKLAEIDRQVIATQKELNDFRAFGRAEQEAGLDRDLERAKIAANKARRDEAALLAAANKEKEKGNQATQVDINLAGLTLDQARNKLAAVRATLAAQKQGATTEAGNTKEVKTQQEIDDEKKSARLDVLDAEQRQRDAERAQAAFKDEADTKEAGLVQQIVDLNGQKIDQQATIVADQNHLNDLRNGETTLALALRDIDKQIADAKKAQAEAATRVRDAVRAARDAEREAAIQAALYTNQQDKAASLIKQQLLDRTALLNLEPAVRDQLNKSLEPLQAGVDKAKELSGQIASLGQQAVNQAKDLKGLFDASVGDAGKTAALLDNNSLPNLLLDAANKALTANPDDPFAKAVKDIILQLNAQRFSGFEKGGFIDGIGDGFGQVIRVAERGAEAVLPLTRPFDMTRVMKDQRVLSPVLQALATIKLPQSSSVSTSASISTSVSTNTLREITRGSGQQVSGRLQKEREQRDFAKMIAEELVAAGFEGNVTVEAPVTIEGQSYNEEILVRRLEQTLVKNIERRLR